MTVWNVDLTDRNWWFALGFLPIAERVSVVKKLYEGKHITDWQLWDILGNYRSPIPCREAVEIYRHFGLVPLCGYPLRRAA